jgi:hypothetical protein
MSDFSTLLGMVRSNLLESGARYKKTTATSAGAADGTTIVSTNLSENDDAWNTMDCLLLDGAMAGIDRESQDFTESSTTLSFANNAFPDQVANGVAFELTEKAIWKGTDLKKYIEQAANWFLRQAKDLNANYTVQESASSLSGVASLPDNVLKFVAPIVTVNGNVAAIIPPEEMQQFDDDPFIDDTNGDPIGFFDGRSSASANVGQFKHKPATNATCVFRFVPRATFDVEGAWKVPEEAWEPIAFIATGLALVANERPDLGGQWLSLGVAMMPEQKDLLKQLTKQLRKAEQ